jgi:hypothetical protein
MRRLGGIFLIFFWTMGFFWLRPILAQNRPPDQVDIDALKKSAVKVYIDCSSCDLEFIKNEITFVNYVRDRNEANVHVLITTQRTGSGGREYTLTFIGQNGFSDVTDVQKFFSSSTDTEDEVRRGQVEALKMGLMSYVGRTPIASRIAVRYAPPGESKPFRDPWNFWVLSLSSWGDFSGQESYRRNYLYGSFSANRVTEKTKTQLSLSYDISSQKYRIESEDRTASGTSKSWEGKGLFVRSLGGRWSAGAYVETESSFYSNVLFSLIVAPALEFDVFPYTESTRRQLRILYRLAWNPVRYHELTRFGKLRETLWTESLSVSLDLREKWGTISTSVSGVNHLNHFTKGHIDTSGTISLNIYKGLNVFVMGGWSVIHDQFSLRLREPTDDEIYLRLVRLETTSDYFFGVGVQFTFGSIFTNVINPRFGSKWGSSMNIHMD